RMESKAKSFKIRKREQEKEEIVQEKDALAISVLTRSGERADTILPWRLGEEKTVEILQTIIHLLKDKLSDTFIYRFIDAFYPLIDINNSEYKVCEKWVGTELKRLLKRSAKSPLSEEELEKSVEAFISFYQNVPSTMDFIYTLKILSFFKRKEV
ncbi:MAG: type III-B CRISPR-associated protein Cas10/Cmr2, partial [Bacillales bacterium]